MATLSTSARATATSDAALAVIPRAVLIVDDDQLCGELLQDLITEQYTTTLPLRRADSLAAARTILGEWSACDLILLDQFLPDGQGIEFIEELRRIAPQAAVILLTGHGGEALAVRAFQRGARDYLAKIDLTSERLRGSIERGLAAVRQQVHAAHSTAELLRVKGELDHFLRAISHDMGANLMLMESTVDVLKQETAPVALPTANEGFAHLEACLRQSNRFIGDLVNLARTGTVEMEPQLVAPDEVAQQVVYEQRRLFAERGIVAEVASNLPTAWLHPARLKQVLTNLVRNAARHGCATQQPRIVIRQTTAPETVLPVGWPAASEMPTLSNTAPLWLAVYDNGPGIPAADRSEIFLPGKRLLTAHAEGSGMGLAIVQKIIDHYGGRVLVDPRLETGTAMIFSLTRPATA